MFGLDSCFTDVSPSEPGYTLLSILHVYWHINCGILSGGIFLALAVEVR